MVVFRYEWKRSRRYILIWAAALAASIFFMTPVYYDMIGTPSGLPENFAQGGFFETVGVSLSMLTEPLGMYSFLNSFFMIAGGIFGMYLGLSLYTKDCTENTAEYLFTKPCGRKAIYCGKTLCVLIGVCVVGAAYLTASFMTMWLFQPGFLLSEFLLLAASFVLVTLLFGGLGLLWGSVWPNNHSPLLTSGLVVFVGYCITAFSRTIDNRMIGLLSPFSYFNPASIHESGFYEWDCLFLCLLLIVAFSVLVYVALMKRDVKFAV